MCALRTVPTGVSGVIGMRVRDGPGPTCTCVYTMDIIQLACAPVYGLTTIVLPVNTARSAGTRIRALVVCVGSAKMASTVPAVGYEPPPALLCFAREICCPGVGRMRFVPCGCEAVRLLCMRSKRFREKSNEREQSGTLVANPEANPCCSICLGAFCVFFVSCSLRIKPKDTFWGYGIAHVDMLARWHACARVFVIIENLQRRNARVVRQT